MKAAAALVILTSSALAQVLPNWSNGACYSNGIYFPARAFGECVDSDRVGFAQTAPPPGLLGIHHSGATVALTSTVTGTVISAAHACPNDRSLVMLGSGSYKCAKDLTDPE